MAGSIHVEVRKAVIDGLTLEFSSEPDVSVTYGWQGSDDTRAREQVFTSNVRADHDPAALKAGRNFRKEQMTFDITILVDGPGQMPEEVETRAIELGTVVEEFLADRKSNELNVDGLNWIHVSKFAADYRLLPSGGSQAIATYTVTYNARLT